MLTKSRTAMWAMLGGLAATLYLLATVRNSSPVAEDAAILMRYARHVGRGLGYIWNVGEPPVDGATDWLGTTLLGALYALGLPLEAGPRVLAGAAHALTVGLVIAIALEGFGAPLAAALVAAAFVAAGPARAYVEAGFLTPLFALGTLAGWACVVFAARGSGIGERGSVTGDRGSGTIDDGRWTIDDGRSGVWRWPVWFGLAMLAATLTRPEGLAVTAIMLVASACVLDKGHLGRFIAATVAVFGTLFVAFVLWRWRYFGRLLPLPFLKKGGGALHLDGLLFSVRGVVILLGWLAPTLVVGLRPGRPLRWLAALSLVVAGHASMWIMLSPEMDYFFRFQYALVPIVASSWCAVWTDVWGDLDRSVRMLPLPLRRLLAVMAIAAAAGGLMWQHCRFVPISTDTGLLDAARLLRRHGTPDNAIVTTEAGLLPLYSEWRAVDAWGLNDVRIVREGSITEAYLSEIRPDVIVFHSYYTPFYRPPHAADGDWNQMVTTLHRHAVCHGYELAGAFAGGPEEAHYYFVNPKWPASGAVSRELKALRYRWWGNTQTVPEVSALEKTTFQCQ